MNQIEGAEHLVQVLDLFLGLNSHGFEFEGLDHLVDLIIGESDLRFNHFNQNVFFIDFFDFDSSVFGTDEGGSLTLSVKNESEIDFSLDVNSFMDKYGVNLESLLGSLVSNQVVANHFSGKISDLFGRVTELDSSLETTGQMAFSSSSGVHLSFYN